MRNNTLSALDNHSKMMVDGVVVPQSLNTLNESNQFQSELEILALSANCHNAFLFNIFSDKLVSYGNTDYTNVLNFSELASILAKSPTKLKTLEFDYKDQLHTFALMLLVDELKIPMAIVGTCLSLHINDNNRRENDGSRLPTARKKLLKLLMLQCQKKMHVELNNQRLQVIHSQHLQLSALNQDYICIKDDAHRLMYANPALCKTFPKTAQDKLLGTTTAEFYLTESINQILESDSIALIQGFYKGIEQITLANGDEKILQTTKKSFVGIDGRKYLMSVSRDITEKEILINDLKRSNADLDNFAYVASHDLKAPLNAIKRLVSWVKEDCDSVLPNESKEDLSIVLSRVDRMEKLLNDLLSYARIGKEYQAASEINLRAFTVELLSLIDLPMGFVFNCDDIDILVPLVPFNVVMLNLVSNAIKHHDSGNAKIEIKAKRNDKGCTISILDNGPGIEEKNRERIFKLFETLKPRDEVEGSGMGLSVVKKIVEHYGGNVKVDKNVPRGSKFIVTWPTNNLARRVLDNIHD